MKTNKILTKHLAPSITGLSGNIYQRCPDETQKKIKALGAIMILTAFISSSMMAYAISKICFSNLIWFAPIFVGWFIFIYLFERLIISGRNIRRSAVLILRVLAALVFACLHSIIMDTVFFRKDIENSLAKEIEASELQIRNHSAIQYERISRSVSGLELQNSKNNQIISNYRDSLIAEAGGSGGSHQIGLGPIYQNLKNNIVDPGIKRLTGQISNSDTRIAELSAQLSAINEQLEKDLDNLPSVNKFGLLAYIKEMHQVVFQSDNFTSILFYVLWFIVFIFIEILPLLGKLSLDLRFYYDILDQYLKYEKTLQSSLLGKETQLKLNRAIISYKSDELEFRREQILENLVADLGQNISEMEVSLNYLKQLQKNCDQFEKEFGQYFSTHGEPLLQKMEERYVNIINQLKTA